MIASVDRLFIQAAEGFQLRRRQRGKPPGEIDPARNSDDLLVERIETGGNNAGIERGHQRPVVDMHAAQKVAYLM